MRRDRFSVAAMNSTQDSDVKAFKERVLRAWQGKPLLLKHFGSKPDDFFQRFLMIKKHQQLSDDFAVQMVTKYGEFINARREEGLLKGLGLKELAPWMQKGYVRVLSGKYRDNEGRRIILTTPAKMGEIPEEMRSKLYLYWFIKFSTYDDAIDPGFVIAHDLSDVSITKLALTAARSSARKMLVDGTFPMNLEKIMILNYGSSWLLRPILSLITAFAPKSANIVKIADVSKEASTFAKHLPRTSLPCGKPYCGAVDEDPAAAATPGLGSFFEPEMDPAEAASISL